MRAIILLALLGAALAVPQGERIQRIVGGAPTTVERFPYISNMQYGLFGVLWIHACGGSLLTSRSIVSGAHCYFGDQTSSWRVRLGSSFASSGGSVHNVQSFILHENYSNSMLSNDVAIVILSTPAIFSNVIQPVRIAGSTFNLPDGTAVTTVGWGAVSFLGSSPEQLRSVDINIINQQLCVERYAHLKTLPGFRNWPDIDNSMICAGILDVGGRDSCRGDSGGPLSFSEDILVGIASWGFGCADDFYPGVNTRVSYLSDWIASNGSV